MFRIRIENILISDISAKLKQKVPFLFPSQVGEVPQIRYQLEVVLTENLRDFQLVFLLRNREPVYLIGIDVALICRSGRTPAFRPFLLLGFFERKLLAINIKGSADRNLDVVNVLSVTVYRTDSECSVPG